MNIEMIVKYPIVFFAAFLLTIILTPLVRKIAVKLGIVDFLDARRIHTAPTPRGGGVAVFFGFHAACAVVFLVPWVPFQSFLNFQWWWRFLLISAFLLGVGIADDCWSLRPLTKLTGQVIAALLLFMAGARFGQTVGFELPWLLDMGLTVLWVLMFVNAFNLIDGLDGLAAGLAVIASLGMAGGLLFRHMPGDVLICLGLMGACLAFLRYNFHPASIFLGDSGSMFLGFALAAIALGTASKGTALASIGVPLLAVGVPVLDTLLAIWRRSVRRMMWQGENAQAHVMQADMEHLHHRLVRTGLSQKKVATGLYIVNALLVSVALLGLFFKTYAVGIFLLAFVAAAYVMVKHLARVELWDSGAAILSGLRRPTNKVLAVILYPLLDAMALSGSFWIAVWLPHPELTGQELKRVWLDSLPIWVGLSFLALFCVNTYRRVWSRARVSEVMELGMALVLGVFLSVGLLMLLEHPANRHLAVQAVLYIGIAVPLVAGLRIFSRVLQDILALSSRHLSLNAQRKIRNILLYGAGNQCILFLRQRSSRYPKMPDDRRIIGLLDDDPNLHGRLVQGYKVLGGMDQLETVLAQRKIAEIVITTILRPETLNRLIVIVRRHEIKLIEWRTEERIVDL